MKWQPEEARPTTASGFLPAGPGGAMSGPGRCCGAVSRPVRGDSALLEAKASVGEVDARDLHVRQSRGRGPATAP